MNESLEGANLEYGPDPASLAEAVNQIGSYYEPRRKSVPFSPRLPPSAAGVGKMGEPGLRPTRSSCQSDSPSRRAGWGHS